MWQQPCAPCFSKTSTFSRRFRLIFGTHLSFRHFGLSKASFVVDDAQLKQLLFRNNYFGLIFLKTMFWPQWRQNKPFRLPTLNKSNHNPAFQPNSNTVIQCPNFNAKPSKMWSDPIRWQRPSAWSTVTFGWKSSVYVLVYNVSSSLYFSGYRALFLQYGQTFD